jgi:hypothetical protein
MVKLLIAKNIATSPTDAITFLTRFVDQRTAHEQGGPLLRSLCSPRLLFAFVHCDTIQRREGPPRLGGLIGGLPMVRATMNGALSCARLARRDCPERAESLLTKTLEFVPHSRTYPSR